MEDEVVVRFVKEAPDPSGPIEEAFEALKEIASICVWFSQDECLEVTKKEKKYIYVFEEFDGAAFENINQTGNRIYGPVCVLACIRNSEPLPKTSFPVFSLAMRGLVISFTNVERSIREKLTTKVQWMHGEFSKDFHDKVTHLISGEVGSKKYKVAANLKKHIMSTEWVPVCWENSKISFNRADDPKILQEYKSKVFTGLVCTMSGLDSTERAQLKEILESNGGSYSGEMKLNECTHLIISVPRGQKYEFAKKWKLHIVTPQWILDSVEAGYVLDEGNFPLDPSAPARTNSTSTPTGDRTARNMSRMSTLGDMSAISVTHINETVANQTRVNQSHVADLDTTSPIDDLDLTKVSSDMFLDGCKIFLSGFAGPRLEKLRRIINMGGGTRLNQLTDAVTHVVVGSKVEQHIQTLKEASFRPHVVSADWLVTCCNESKCAEEAPFHCLDLPAVKSATPKKPPKDLNISSKSKANRSVGQGQPRRSSVTPAEPDDMADIMSQYSMQQPQPSMPEMTNESSLMRAAAALENDTTMETSKKEETTMREEAARNTTGVDNDETMDCETTTFEGGIFANKSFIIVGFSKPDEEELISYIQENAGQVLPQTSRGVPDYAVVSILSTPIQRAVGSVVTNAWLQMCIENGCLLPIDSSPLFTPMVINEDTRPLTGCVLSISGYTGTERDVLIHIGQILGATCQEYFVKKSKNDLQASTHLIVNAPHGSKFAAARKWNLPALTKEWLIDCATSGRRCSEDEYDVETMHQTQDTTVEEKTQTPAKNIATKSTENTTPPDAKPDDGVPNADISIQNNRNSIDKQPLRTLKDQENNITPKVVTPKAVAQGLRGITPKGITPTLQNQRVKNIIQEDKRTPRIKSGNPGIETPSKFLAPGVIFYPKFDLDDVMAALESPARLTPGGKKRRKSSLSLEDYMTHVLAIAIKNTSKKETKDDTNQGSSTETTSTVFKTPAREAPPAPLKGVIIAVAKKLSHNQGEYNNMVQSLGGDYRWTYDKSCTHFIFQGRKNDTNKEFKTATKDRMLIVCPHWLYMCQEQNCRVDESLFPHTFNPNMSLSMTPAKTPVSARPTRASSRRAARKEETTTKTAEVKHVDTTTRSVPEFPGRLSDFSGISEKSAKSLPNTETSRSTRGQKAVPEVTFDEDEGQAEVKDKGSDDLDTTQSDDDMAKACEVVETEEKEAKTQVLVQGLQSLMAATRSKERRKKIRRTGSSDASLEEFSRRSRPGSRSGLRIPDPGTDTHTEASQAYEVTWDDPQARQQRERMASELAKNSESFSPRHDHYSDHDKTKSDQESFNEDHIDAILNKKKKDRLSSESNERVPTPERPPLAFPRPSPHNPASPPRPVEPLHSDPDETRDEIHIPKSPPRFMMSGMSQAERDEYAALVEKLGGITIESSYYDVSCTHLVVATPSRNEKTLACIAAGKWVLHKSYFVASRECERFVTEEEHEWGGHGTMGILQGMPGAVGKLAASAVKWRQTLCERRKTSPGVGGAFDGWIVVLVTSTKKEENFRRLLEAGGAKVVGTRPPFTNLTQVTHAFMELSKTNVDVDLDSFISHDIKCLKPEYIASYLTEDPLPNVQMFYIEEVKAKLGADRNGRKRRQTSGHQSTPTSKKSRR